jgi:flagellar hook-associated protein 3 FlgL
MRIADKMNYDQVNAGLQKNRTDLANLQNQAATQKRINKPSDDPLAATRLLATRTDLQGAQQFIKNINQAKSFVEFSEQSLSEMGDIILRAKELAISQSNDASANEGTRRSTAAEIEQLRGQAIQVANRKMGDRFLFGGFRTNSAPFTPDGDYLGDGGEIQVAINRESKVPLNVPGNRVFLGESREARAPRVPEPSIEDTPGRSEPKIPVREPASQFPELRPSPPQPEGAQAREQKVAENISETWRSGGTNVFRVLSDLEVSLRANSKEGVQEALDRLDSALAQVVVARSEIGTRMSTLNSASENLSKGVVENKSLASSLEDVDTFELVSELNKSESTLKASLASSSKLIQPSLLDFLR